MPKDEMYTSAYQDDLEQIIYLDAYGNQYVVKGGSLPWRINNPGLVQSHSHVAKRNGSIGACGSYAIFATPEQGHHALSSWLRLKKYSNSTIKAIARHYQPRDYEGFILKLNALAAIPEHKKIKSFSSYDFTLLKRALEKLCKFVAVGNEEQRLLPKIIGKIEHGNGIENSYLINDDIILSKSEAIEWIQSHRLDASIVHETNGKVHIRSRPGHSFWQIRGSPLTGNPIPDKSVATLVRTVGTHRAGQCIWGFINGISNTKVDALRSTEIISAAANDEAVLSMPNDTSRLLDLFACGALKCGMDIPIIMLAVHFLRYLLSLANAGSHKVPVIIFAHSQGAIICEHALEQLSISERNDLRIFSLGGGSLIPSGKSHTDSHNYASAADLICRLGSPHLQILALEDYVAHKKDCSREELIENLAMRDALLQIDSLDITVTQKYAKERSHYYEQEFAKLNNVTVLDPDPGCNWQHGFENKCYQQVVQSIIKRYQSGEK